jgi:HAD superfamily hydrolase (TIGR01548 family)
MKTQNLPVDALIFDIDGVLVDVSNSYHETIIQTVDLFFNTGLGLRYEGEEVPLLGKNEVELLRMTSGFSNNWDLTTAFIIYFLEMLPPLAAPTFPLRRHVPAILAYLQMTGGGHLPVTMDQLRRNKDIRRLARRAVTVGGGPSSIDKVLTHRNRHLIITGDSPLKGNLIQRIFQEFYLGQTLFEEIYGEKPVVIHTPGVINNETLIISPAILENLVSQINLGIATGRPRAEAQYTLQRLGIADYFHSLVTYDDIIAANASAKPAPWSLLEAASRLHPTPARSAYVGDSVDDVLAAKAASQSVPFLAIATLASVHNKTAMRKLFEEKRADMIIGHPDRLKDIIFR